MTSFLTSQLAAQLTTIVIFLPTLYLALIMTKRLMAKRGRSLMLWTSGVWFFVIGVALEILFAFGIYSLSMINIYLLVVAILVELLALGSINLINSSKIKSAYLAFCILATGFLAYTLLAYNVGNILTNYIVYGSLPFWIAISSSLVTFPAAIVLIAVAAKSYAKGKDKRMLSIIAGVIIVSIAGTLYLVQYPAFLYAAEFIGIAMLIYGFL